MRVSSSWMRHIYTAGMRLSPLLLGEIPVCFCGFSLNLKESKSWCFCFASDGSVFVFFSRQKCAGTELIRKQKKAVKEGLCWASRSSYFPAGSAATPAVNQPVVRCGWNCCSLESHGKVRALTLAIRGNETRTPGQRGESGKVSVIWPCVSAGWFLLGSQVITSTGAATGSEINIYDIRLSVSYPTTSL